MNIAELQEFQNTIVKQMMLAAAHIPLSKATAIQKIYLRLFGNLIRQKRLANVKTLLPNTIRYLSAHQQLAELLKSFFIHYPQQQLDYFTNAHNFYDCLTHHTFKDQQFYAKVLSIAEYEKALIHASYYSDHATHHLNYLDKRIILNGAAQLLNLIYDIRPLLKSHDYKSDLSKTNIQLLICWDYTQQQVRVFELAPRDYYLLTHLDQLPQNYDLLRHSHFWQTLFRSKVLEISA